MVGMKGGFTDGKNSRETFRDRKTARAIVDNAAGTKASDGNADAEKEGCI